LQQSGDSLSDSLSRCCTRFILEFGPLLEINVSIAMHSGENNKQNPLAK